ncbi:MAG: hypothetical protein KDC46_09545 [Thermoleophilia bacterium]|nr:hypothetical protein [Thermoleophilia bacterium]
MPAINVMRSWADEAMLALQRMDEARGALAELVAHPAQADDATHAIASGSTWDDPFDAIRELADGGNRGLWDGWSKAEAAQSILTRAVQKHPGGEGVVQLQRAQAFADEAGGAIGNWVAEGGRGATLAQVETFARQHLDEARAAAQRAIDAAPAPEPRNPLAGARRTIHW